MGSPRRFADASRSGFRDTFASLFLLLLAATGTALLAGIAHAGEAHTLTGEYIAGEGDDSGDLEAVFTATGEGAWAVTFRFSFQGQPHTYHGTADGSLSEGSLEGRVENESGSRFFSFWGEFEGGTFRGSHAEIENGFEEPTGTLTLRP